MKSVLLASFAMLFASSAMAADAIVAEPAPVAVDTFSWTGGYIGINAGYAGGKFKHPFSVAGLPTAGMNEEGGALSGSLDVTSSGFVGGVQAGYNWQLDNGFVLGAEADFQGSTVKGDISAHLDDLDGNAETKVEWFGTVRARLGYTATERLLVYGTGGLAYGKVKSSLGIEDWGVSSSKTKAGWTVGAGAEYAINNNWTLKSEYLYTDLGKHDLINVNELSLKNDVKFHTVRVGLNYKF
ncbi:porin family protein [Brucella sp. 6810]|uniref:Porin family protein n=1 Tax=Brucella inopinata TaxID=1218315 RepID=A0AAW7BB17_9HYPH|nr:MULTISPECIES: outer membrane protein [Brucella]KEY03428.1 membrane protein [Brucella suis bv. 4 str. 40]EFM55083.1 outer membrane protein Omp31 [Brucella inopinata BO1]EFM60252.1 outer membrane protein Omp31 [Brucella sp. BO2]MDL2333681.1 porin family protein [Brucella inopinata]MRN42849.1 outer membrane beta-barrel protein [Brucella sp. 09RB8913]